MDFFTRCFGSLSRENLKTDSSPESLKTTLASTSTNQRQLRSRGPTDEEIVRFENELRSEQASKDPLVSPLLPLSFLSEEFASQPNFAHKLELLTMPPHNFSNIRKCRRDGNCFYRAVAYGLIEAFKVDESAAERYENQWKEALKAAGYEATIYEDFSDSFWSYCKKIKSDNGDTIILTEDLWNADEYTSNLAIMLLRLLTSAHIRSNPTNFLAFIELFPSESITQWCERNIDAVGVDADQVQLIALAKSVQIALVVANLGSGMDQDDLQVSVFDFKNEASDPTIQLLYRPGHYDLLYKTES